MSEQTQQDMPTAEAMNRMSEALETLNSHRFLRVNNSFWRMLWFQLARGLAFGLGTALGASLLVSVVAWWLSQVEFVPILGNWATQILDSMDTTQQ